MNNPILSRRTFLAQSGVALAGLALLNAPFVTPALQAGEEVIPWLDQLAANPVPDVIANQLKWEDLDAWLTPNDKFFSIARYNRPQIDPATWQLEISGLVGQLLTLTLDDLKARPRVELTFTGECAGNHDLPFFIGGIGDKRSLTKSDHTRKTRKPWLPKQ